MQQAWQLRWQLDNVASGQAHEQCGALGAQVFSLFARAARKHGIYDVLALPKLQQHLSSERDGPQLRRWSDAL